MLTIEQERLIMDNQNLSSSIIASLIGLHKNTVINAKKRLGINPKWFHFGRGIPFVDYDRVLTAYRIRKDGRKIYNGSFSSVMENLDRLIYCLDNNNGKLPPTMKEYVFDNLKFGER